MENISFEKRSTKNKGTADLSESNQVGPNGHKINQQFYFADLKWMIKEILSKK